MLFDSRLTRMLQSQVHEGREVRRSEVLTASNEGPAPSFSREIVGVNEQGGMGESTRSAGSFYPSSLASWFVGNAFTFSRTSEEGRNDLLDLQVGLRHEDMKASCIFSYQRRKEEEGTWELVRMSVGREKLGSMPTGDEYVLFREEKGRMEDGTELSGPADRLSTNYTPMPGKEGVMTVEAEGGIAVQGPSVLSEKDGERREVVISWSTPSTEVRRRKSKRRGRRRGRRRRRRRRG